MFNLLYLKEYEITASQKTTIDLVSIVSSSYMNGQNYLFLILKASQCDKLTYFSQDLALCLGLSSNSNRKEGDSKLF